MKASNLAVIILLLAVVLSAGAQTPTPSTQEVPILAQVPPVLQFGNIAADEAGRPLTGTVEITFSLYDNAQGGVRLWSETQNVTLDEAGHYAVYLGITQTGGVPTALFTTGQAHWLGVQIAGQAEQPRVFLVSVPYALKAGDAETVGGLPPSAFMLAAPSVPLAGDATGAAPTAAGTATTHKKTSVSQAQAPCSSLTSDGTAGVNALAKFTTGCNVEGSGISEDSNGRVGIGAAGLSTSKLYVTDTQTNFGTKWLQRNIFNTSATKNGTNESLAFDLDQSNMTIPPGVTDNGYRLAVRGVAYAATTGFAGTLAQQLGMVGEAGILQAKSGAKIGTAIGGEFEVLSRTAGTTITNGYGVYIYNGDTAGTITNRYDLYASSPNANNYFAGNLGVGTANPVAKLEVNGQSQFDSLVTIQGGNLALPNTKSSSVGVITIGSVPFLHNYGPAGSDSVFVGGAGNFTTTGLWNVAVGSQALTSVTSGNTNVAIGYQVLQANTTGFENTALGYQAMFSNSSGGQNTAIGDGTLRANTTGGGNVAIGTDTLYRNTTGRDNTAINGGLSNNTTGSDNVAVGRASLFSNTTGGSNTAEGEFALYANTTGNYNTASGFGALYDNSSGINNTALGYFAGRTQNAMTYSTGNNTFIGALSTAATQSVANATALGAFAYVAGSDATAIGANAEVAANDSLVLGSIKGVNGASASTSVGIGTTAPAAKLSVSGAESTAGGFGAAVEISNTATGGANWYLRAGATGTNTPAGGFSVGNDSLYAMSIDSTGRVGIHTATPSNVFAIAQNAGHAIADGWDTYSSRRWKTNIQTLPNALAKVDKLRGVSYDLKESGKHEIGVIAEEVGPVVPEVVTYEENGKDARGVDYSRLTALLLEATKEQHALIRQQQRQIRSQQAQLKAQQSEIKAQQTRCEIQQAQIAELASQVRAIRASLKTNGRIGSQAQTVKAVRATVPVAQQ